MDFNKSKIIFITFISLFLFAGNVLAQDPQTLYYMNSVPQSIQMNPAMQPKYNFYLGLPVVSSIQIGLGNNQLAVSDILMKHPTEDSLITFLHPDAEFSTSDFLSKLDDNNFFYEDFSTDLLSFGFRVKSWYFSVNLSEKFSMSMNYPKDLMVLALKGNQSFNNAIADLSYLGVNASFYREYGFGISKEINKNLSVGLKAKVLFGHANIYSNYNDNKLEMYSSPDSLYLNANAVVRTSSPMIATHDEEGYFEGFDMPGFIENSDMDSLIDYGLSHENMGLGIDFGVRYKPIDKLWLSLSVIDLGYIQWDAKNVTSVRLRGNYAFNGVDMSDLDSIDSGFDNLGDSISNIFKPTSSQSAYKTTLGTKIYIGANYDLTKSFGVGLLSRSYIYNNFINQSFTLSANVHIRGFAASLSYSTMNSSYNNIGFGLVLGGAPLQIYLVSDNISAAFWGEKTTSVNFRFGLNVAIGSNNKSKFKDIPLLKSNF